MWHLRPCRFKYYFFWVELPELEEPLPEVEELFPEVEELLPEVEEPIVLL